MTRQTGGLDDARQWTESSATPPGLRKRSLLLASTIPTFTLVGFHERHP